MMWRASTILSALLAVSTPWLSLTLRADLLVEVDAEGALEGAVLTAYPLDGRSGGPVPPAAVQMIQANRQFDPFILPVPVSVPVEFPNRDGTAHHVYSFSPIGSFELPLYKGDASRPVVFSEPGVVPLGCNIHDWMIGYLYVVDTPWYTQLLNNGARFQNLSEGAWEIRIWHPAIDHLPSPAWQVMVSTAAQTETLSLEFPFTAVTQPRAPRARFDEADDY